ncbi:hypothetical protein LBMAG48_09670 [Phycisphaerae bacterium]|nr:hypothetical protein LBMAG48_09670 [Phycisphaerae bacterium]
MPGILSVGESGGCEQRADEGAEAMAYPCLREMGLEAWHGTYSDCRRNCGILFGWLVVTDAWTRRGTADQRHRE